MNDLRLVAVVLALIGGATAIVRPAQAQFFGPNSGRAATENIEGVTVAGKGEVAARPNLMEIDLEVVAASELTADAIVKYRDARRKIQEAFTALKLPNISVDERGLLVNKKGAMTSRYFFSGYEQNNRAKTEVQLSRKLVVKGTDIRQMDEEALLQLTAKLLDVAQDAGAKVGGSNDMDAYFYYYDYARRSEGLVRFVLEDFEKLQEEAYGKAIADAQARAQRLARLSRVELGPIVAVQEVLVPGETPHQPGGGGDEDEPRKRLVSSKFQEIRVRVELLVRFEVHPKAENKGPADNR
jgi:uncharacterized protein YggE